jgi:hypothetical protein
MPTKKAAAAAAVFNELLPSNPSRDPHASKHPDRHLGKSSNVTTLNTSASTSSAHKSAPSSSSKQQQIDRSPQKKSSGTRSVQDEVDVAVPPRAKKRKTTELEHLLNSF